MKADLPPIQIILEQLTQSMGFEDVSVTLLPSSIPGHVTYNVISKNSALLIGRGGKNLQALSKLVRDILETKSEKVNHHYELENFIIDVDGYQEKEVVMLLKSIDSAIKKLGVEISEVELKPMSPFHRRVVHAYVQDKNGLKTESTGIGMQRKVIIKT